MPYRSPPSAGRLVLVTTLFLLAACATVPAPVQELAAAEQAVQAAEATDAATLAPAELDKARRKLDQARLALAAGQHVKTRQLAEQAAVDADLAEITARAERAARSAAQIRAQIRDPGDPAQPAMPRRAGS